MILAGAYLLNEAGTIQEKKNQKKTSFKNIFVHFEIESQPEKMYF
jgi:hypothetical protein